MTYSSDRNHGQRWTTQKVQVFSTVDVGQGVLAIYLAVVERHSDLLHESDRSEDSRVHSAKWIFKAFSSLYRVLLFGSYLCSIPSFVWDAVIVLHFSCELSHDFCKCGEEETC